MRDAMLDIAFMMAFTEVLTMEAEDPDAAEDVDATVSSGVKAAFAAKLATTKEAARNSHTKQQQKQHKKTATESRTDHQKRTTTKAMFSDSMQKMKALNRILLDEQRKRGIPGYSW